jgi:carotenoid cleavage dioxygenase-like enzyme
VEGTIPKELKGTYFRNGPGLQASSHTHSSKQQQLQQQQQAARVALSMS